MADEQRPNSFDEFDARLKKLRSAPDPAAAKPDEVRQPLNFGSGLQVGIELVAGVGGGFLIGWALDRWLGTTPLFLILFFILGAAAGVLNAYRHLRRLQDRADAS